MIECVVCGVSIMHNVCVCGSSVMVCVRECEWWLVWCQLVVCCVMCVNE